MERLQLYRRILLKNPVYYKTAIKCEAAICGQNACDMLYLNVMAPVLLDYVKWVLANAVRAGKKRLYFLARDGWQMYLAASRLCAEWGIEIDCRYLKVSRYSVRVPEYFLIKEKCLDRICIGGMDVTFSKIMKRAALTEEEGLEIAGLTGYSGSYHQMMGYQEVIRLKDKLRNQEAFFRYTYEHSKRAYPSAIGYFKQEGLLDGVPYALVDSGWTGTLQQTLKNLLQTRDARHRPEGYYFGLYEIPLGESRKDYHSFYFGPRNGICKKVHFSNCLFEAIFTAPTGMTMEYRQENGIYFPVLNSEENKNCRQIAGNISVLQTFLTEYLQNETEEGMLRSDSRMADELLSKFMGEPTELEVNSYGRSLFSDDVLENGLKTVCADLSDKEIRQQHFFHKLFIYLGIKKEILRESAWIEGSIVKNGVHIKKNLWHAAMYKYFVYIRKTMKRE